MTHKIYSGTVVGLSAASVEVEVDVSSGLPAIVIVGLPDTAVHEAKVRVKSAIKNSNSIFPRSRVSINLAPADVPKNGTHFDLPIAISILLNSGQIFFDPKGKLLVGELALDGSLRPVTGVLPIALLARDLGFEFLIIPKDNCKEASLISGIAIIPVESLIQLIGYLQGLIKIEPLQPFDWQEVLKSPEITFDMKLVKGQEAAKRALEIAAAGGHNLLLSGPPGTGKTLLARALPSTLPKLTADGVFGRISGIYPGGTGKFKAAFGRWGSDGGAGRGNRDVSRTVYFGRRPESLPLRILFGSDQGLHLHPLADYEVSKEDLRPAPRSDRSACGGRPH